MTGLRPRIEVFRAAACPGFRPGRGGPNTFFCAGPVAAAGAEYPDGSNACRLITDHNVAQTLKVCDRALIIEDGRVRFEGTPKEVLNDPGVKGAYTGNLFRGDEVG